MRTPLRTEKARPYPDKQWREMSHERHQCMVAERTCACPSSCNEWFSNGILKYGGWTYVVWILA